KYVRRLIYGIAVIFLALAAIGLIVGEDVPTGGEPWYAVAGQSFPAEGPRIEDQKLLKQAKAVWKDNARGTLVDEGYIRALWAGDVNGVPTVFMQCGADFAAVVGGALQRAQLVGNRFIVADRMVLLAAGAPAHWTGSGFDGAAQYRLLAVPEQLAAL